MRTARRCAILVKLPVAFSGATSANDTPVAGAMLYRYDNHMAPIHDALAIAYLINENVVTELADANVDIDIAGGLCDGRMVADFHNTKKCKDPVTAKVALNSDAGLFTDMLFAALGK